MPDNLSKKEKRELRRIEWQEKAKKDARNSEFKKYALWGGGVFLFAVLLFGLIKFAGSSQSPKEIANLPPVTASDYQVGTPSVKVIMIEYGDFQCPACATFYSIVKQLKEEYKNDLLFVFRDFPLTNIHRNALLSSQAAYAANMQGKYWEMHDLIYTNQTTWAESGDAASIFADYAKKLDLDADQFTKDMNSDEAKTFVKEGENNAISLGLNSTPSIFLNNKLLNIPLSYEAFKKAIDEELK